jgi:hypothetical protein
MPSGVLEFVDAVQDGLGGITRADAHTVAVRRMAYSSVATTANRLPEVGIVSRRRPRLQEIYMRFSRWQNVMSLPVQAGSPVFVLLLLCYCDF